MDEFSWRGLIHSASSGLWEHLARGPLTAYIGFDPSAPSLHVGSLLPILALARLQRLGHTPIAVVGGGTGLIGDPSGKTQERALLDKEVARQNAEKIREQLRRFLDFEARTNPARLVDNAEWLCPMPLLDFLRDIGKFFSVGTLLSKESVRLRMESETGISFTEFAYSLLQAYDFLVLYDRFGCTLQMGGSDQWGNITLGIDLVRRLRGAEVHGLVFPLLTTASGTKFGKTEAGTVWLDPERTSPFRLYQFWLNTDDRDVITYLKYFTWLSQGEVEGLAASVATHPEKREAQRALAREVTRLVHGESGLQAAERATAVLFGAHPGDLGAADILEIFRDVPSTEVPATSFEGEGLPVIDLLVTCRVATSRGDARRLVQGGGLYLNSERVSDPAFRVTLDQAIEGQVIVLRKGQKGHHVVRVLR